MISKERAAEIAAKELGITDFEFEKEGAIEDPMFNPLGPATPRKFSAITSDQRKKVSDNDGF